MSLALAAEPPPDGASEPEVAEKQQAREEDPAKPPARAPKPVSSFFGECVPPLSSSRAGRRQAGLSPEHALPRGRSDPCLLASRAGGGSQEEGPQSPDFVPSPPETGNQERRERGGTWRGKTGGDQGVSPSRLSSEEDRALREGLRCVQILLI